MHELVASPREWERRHAGLAVTSLLARKGPLLAHAQRRHRNYALEAMRLSVTCTAGLCNAELVAFAAPHATQLLNDTGLSTRVVHDLVGINFTSGI